MKTRDIVAVLGVAAATMAFTLVLCLPGQVGAVDEPEGIKPQIAQPKLTVAGCEFTLTTDKPAYQPGEKPILKLTATNPTDQPAEATVHVSLDIRGIELMISRVARIPEPVWNGDWSVKLEPGETKEIELEPGAAIPAAGMVSVSLSNKDQTVMLKQMPVQALQVPAVQLGQQSQGL